MLIYLFGALIIITISVLQTNVVGAIEIAGARPDIALLFTLYLANRNGPTVGESAGFLSGLTQDILSIAPLGFYTLANTVLGLLYGFTRGNVYLDAFLAPVVMVFVATILKGLMFFLIGAVFSISEPLGSVWSLQFLMEIAYNTVLAPLVFGILGRFRSLELNWRARSF
ncbi:MAG: rod shape-determining protein MreD [Spirochaetota bacterium]